MRSTRYRTLSLLIVSLGTAALSGFRGQILGARTALQSCTIIGII